MDRKRKPSQVMETKVQGVLGRGRPSTECAQHMRKVRREKGKILQEVTRLAKDRKVFQIWLKQSNA